jgi:hypothetical protein
MTQEISAEEIGRLGERIYEERIRPSVEAGNTGRYLVLNTETGDYRIGEDLPTLTRSMRKAYPGAELYSVRIGYNHTARIGRSADTWR